MGDKRGAIVLTDHPWADIDLERGLVEAAGYRLVGGGQQAGSAVFVETLVAGADPVAILTCWAPVSAQAITTPTALAMVGRVGVGLDNIDVAAATARGAWVTNVPDYCVAEVSDHALALLLAALRGVMLDRDVKARGWHVPALVPRRLADLTVAVIGYGRIGRETARKLAAFGCRVLACDPAATSAGPVAMLADSATVQREADAIILHVPLTAASAHAPATTHMIDAGFMASCRRRPLLVNVSRGGLIDSDALLAALEAGTIGGAALDVVEGEPSPSAALLSRADVIVTPHIAYLSDASLLELRRWSCEEALRVLRGEAPLHPCNTPRAAS